MGTNWISVGLRLCLLLSLAAFLAETSFAGIIYNVGGAAAGGINCSPVVTATSASCSTSFSGSFGGGQLLANMDAYASATYGALHVGADASLDMTTNPTVVNALVSDAFASVTTQDTFRPSLLTGTLEYQLSIDGSLTQLTPGCFNCRSSLVLTIATTGLSQDFDQQVLVLEGDLGQVSRTLTVDIPYHYLANKQCFRETDGSTIATTFAGSRPIVASPSGNGMVRSFEGPAITSSLGRCQTPFFCHCERSEETRQWKNLNLYFNINIVLLLSELIVLFSLKFF